MLAASSNGFKEPCRRPRRRSSQHEVRLPY